MALGRAQNLTPPDRTLQARRTLLRSSHVLTHFAPSTRMRWGRVKSWKDGVTRVVGGRQGHGSHLPSEGRSLRGQGQGQGRGRGRPHGAPRSCPANGLREDSSPARGHAPAAGRPTCPTRAAWVPQGGRAPGGSRAPEPGGVRGGLAHLSAQSSFLRWSRGHPPPRLPALWAGASRRTPCGAAWTRGSSPGPLAPESTLGTSSGKS